MWFEGYRERRLEHERHSSKRLNNKLVHQPYTPVIVVSRVFSWELVKLVVAHNPSLHRRRAVQCHNRSFWSTVKTIFYSKAAHMQYSNPSIQCGNIMKISEIQMEWKRRTKKSAKKLRWYLDRDIPLYLTLTCLTSIETSTYQRVFHPREQQKKFQFSTRSCTVRYGTVQCYDITLLWPGRAGVQY